MSSKANATCQGRVLVQRQIDVCQNVLESSHRISPMMFWSVCHRAWPSDTDFESVPEVTA